jgi:hypothetical protein
MPRHFLPALLFTCLACATLAACGGIEHESSLATDTSKAATPSGAPPSPELVNKPPVIDTKMTATVVAAGRAAQLQVGVSDADGDPVTLTVEQLGGSIPLANLAADSRGIRFDAPNVTRATSVVLVLQAIDAAGLVSYSQLSLTVSPVSRSGELFTVIGSPAAGGLHWVITGDGFTAGEQQDLLRSAFALARHFANAPELARHSAIWNVHVLAATSRDSGITERRLRFASRTAFDATLHCTDVDRVACLNWNKVYAAILGERAGFDAATVILNTDLYVGSASSSGVVVSRHAQAAAVALHEMGHLVAGLADEYVDANIARGLLPYYKEGQFPNVTTVADAGRTPWRHWFADSAHIPADPGEEGVGRFEGAYYMQSGFYRPTRDSFMRTVGAPIGSVNAEAWLRAQYRAIPPLSATYPAHPAVSGYAGATLTFEIASLWPADVMTVRWFVDDVEIESARNARRFEFAADGLRHEIHVSTEDRTALIRAPEAREHIGNFTWTVSPGSALVASKAERNVDEVGGWIHMRVDTAGHEVLGVTTTEPLIPHRLGGAMESGFEYALFDAGGALLSERRIADPRAVRAPLALPGTSESGHQATTLESGYYLIEVPAGTEARKLRIRAVRELGENASVSKTGATPIEQWLDL